MMQNVAAITQIQSGVGLALRIRKGYIRLLFQAQKGTLLESTVGQAPGGAGRHARTTYL